MKSFFIKLQGEDLKDTEIPEEVKELSECLKKVKEDNNKEILINSLKKANYNFLIKNDKGVSSITNDYNKVDDFNNIVIGDKLIQESNGILGNRIVDFYCLDLDNFVIFIMRLVTSILGSIGETNIDKQYDTWTDVYKQLVDDNNIDKI